MQRNRWDYFRNSACWLFGNIVKSLPSKRMVYAFALETVWKSFLIILIYYVHILYSKISNYICSTSFLKSNFERGDPMS